MSDKKARELAAFSQALGLGNSFLSDLIEKATTSHRALTAQGVLSVLNENLPITCYAEALSYEDGSLKVYLSPGKLEEAFCKTVETDDKAKIAALQGEVDRLKEKVSELHLRLYGEDYEEVLY